MSVSTDSNASSRLPLAAAIGLGANLGDPVATMLESVRRLEARGWYGSRLSSFYLTAPVDCIPGTPDFVNAAVTGHWPGSPVALRHACAEIERQLGRSEVRGKDRARTIDLDILLLDQLVLREQRLQVPHPLLIKRLFVLVPLAEIAGDWPVPLDRGRRTVSALAEDLRRRTPDFDRRIRLLTLPQA